MKPQGYIPPASAPGAHEGADLNVRAIRRAAISIAVIVALLILSLGLLFQSLERSYPGRTSEGSPVVPPTSLPPTPRVQADPARDLQELQAKEDLHLHRYAWVDRDQGIAQIPIDRAMDLWGQNVTAPPSAPNPPQAPPVTELQMRQQKAQEGARVP